MRIGQYQEWWGRYSILEAQVAEARAFIQIEIILMSQEKIKKFMTDKSELKIYHHFFSGLQSKKKHVLSNEVEDISTIQPYNTVANKMNKMMDEMEFILNQ